LFWKGSGDSDPPEQIEAIGHEIDSVSSPNWVADDQHNVLKAPGLQPQF
jgi:hypothetical protein